MQPGFFDLDDRYQLLEKLGDPLPKLNAVADWEGFRPILQRVREKERKSNAGRKGYDVVLMFKVLVLQHFYNLADEQVEYQIRDRYSFCRFLGLTPEGKVPDARTVWLFREHLKELDLMDELFAELMAQIEAAGFIPKQGQIVDASIVAAPRQRNSREENEAIRRGEVPEGWKDKPAMLRQKDVEARWTKKHGKSYYGYKNHISIDRKHKLVRHFEVTDAATHDSQVFDVLLDDTNTSGDIWADSAYRSAEREIHLREPGHRSHIQTKGTSQKPLTGRQKAANRRRAQVRARVEHVFGAQAAMGGKLVRTIGLARARVKIAMTNMTYNLRRWAWLEATGAA
ncbi:IS5 family transposase [Thioalkalivibrio sulfidiphilus]|uniref:IS5 family transposase n=1 Tax=Thioalkalivibrio sulfidiphilus TaxID=1033854 RepID=UPI00037BC788|nr:IS5 family transposase [Thioalkalivibrio sulfidiphilus]